LFVTSADPRAGKTTVAAAMVRRLRVLGLRAIGMKPIETGCAHGDDHDLVAADGALLHLAAHRSAPPLVVSPYRLASPLDPAAALEQAGLELVLEDLVQAVESAFAFGDIVVVECPGRALSPLTSDALGLDLAERVGATLLVAAPDREGTTSSVLLVLEAARRRALNIAGVVLSRVLGEDVGQDVRWIRERGGVKVFGPIPFIAGDDKTRIAELETHLLQTGMAEAILDALRRP
jgi:dethiobiotin synthetase